MKLLHSIIVRFAITTIACILVGCAMAGPKTALHSFEFHVDWDSPDVELLDYRYGTSTQQGTFPADWVLRTGRVAQSVGTTGDMIVGEFLYVKWKIKETGEIYKDTVDLRTRLPKNLYEHKIYFVIRGPQLYVYLITPNRSPPGTPPNGLKIYGSRIVKKLYPN